MSKKPADKAQLYQRELDINFYISQGLRRKDICKKIGEKYNISPRTVERQYSSILKRMSEDIEKSRTDLRNELMTRNDEIYKRSMSEGKFKVALDANMAQAKLANLFEKQEKEEKRPEIIDIVEQDFGKLKAVPDDNK